MSSSVPPSGASNAPTVLLVHGAFADGSSWSGVITELAAAGITDVTAPANPLRGLAADAAYIAALAGRIDGPVLLAGHSYGAAVSGVAAAFADNVVGVVSIAGFLVDQGESCLDVNGRFPETPFGAALNPIALGALGGAEPVTDLYLQVDAFRSAFAADVDPERAVLMARTQRPVAAAALEEPAPAAGWRSIPTWALVATEDRAIHPDAQRFMAERAEATTVEVEGSHAVGVSRPAAVAEIIAAAVTARRVASAAH